MEHLSKVQVIFIVPSNRSDNTTICSQSKGEKNCDCQKILGYLKHHILVRSVMIIHNFVQENAMNTSLMMINT